MRAFNPAKAQGYRMAPFGRYSSSDLALMGSTVSIGAEVANTV